MKKRHFLLVLLPLSFLCAACGNVFGYHIDLSKLPTVPPPPAAAAGDVGHAAQPDPTKDTVVTSFLGSIQRHVPPAPKPLAASDMNGYLNLCALDASREDFSQRADALLTSTFDTNTVWPANLPAGFDQAVWLVSGQNPGLGVNALHQQGLTGQGVAVAMVGEPIPTGHDEFKDNLVDYEEIRTQSPDADLHATAELSLLAGKTVGVAPDAKIYYFAATMQAEDTSDDAGGLLSQTMNDMNIPDNLDFQYYAQALQRILDINTQLSARDRIKLVLVDGYWSAANSSFGGGQSLRNAAHYAEFIDVLVQLEAQEVFVFSRNTAYDYQFTTQALGRDPLANPDSGPYTLSNYTLKVLEDPQRKVSSTRDDSMFSHTVAFPVDHLTLASPYGNRSYAHISAAPGLHPGNLNMPADGYSEAFAAGLYALCCEESSQIKPADFVNALQETADDMPVSFLGYWNKGTEAFPVLVRQQVTVTFHRVNPGKLVGRFAQ